MIFGVDYYPEPLITYKEGHYAGKSAFTKNTYGKGTVYYVGFDGYLQTFGVEVIRE
ncbi:MAG: beta-galactosidase trimerization domain-containing protein [Lachnospiraceae bacterium]|nr:beta-galactosidase trimerization domain-containing protein [Lachnospiraceae bacterium]